MSTSPADLALDVQPWPRGASGGQVVADYVRGVGLRPEDSFGILPLEKNARELLFVYRDRNEYRQARAGYASGVERGTFAFPGVTIQTGPAPLSTGDQAEALQAVAAQLHGLGFGDIAAGLADAAVPPAAGTIFVQSLQWPGTRRVEGWKTPASALTTYAATVGLAAADVYGFVPGRWDRQGSGVDHWFGFSLVYRDRPEYAAGRARMAARGDRWETGDSAAYPGPPAPAPADAPHVSPSPAAVEVDERKWPRGRMRRLRGDDAAAHVAELLRGLGVAPEDCFGVGPDRYQDELWVAWARG